MMIKITPNKPNNSPKRNINTQKNHNKIFNEKNTSPNFLAAEKQKQWSYPVPPYLSVVKQKESNITTAWLKNTHKPKPSKCISSKSEPFKFKDFSNKPPYLANWAQNAYH